MKLLILSILITLSHSDDAGSFVKAGKKTASLLKDYINTGKHLNKYLDKKGVKDQLDVQVAKSKARIVDRARKIAERLDRHKDLLGYEKYQVKGLNNGYQRDPILNAVKTRRHSGDSETYEDSNSRSSSRELKDWKTEWKENRMTEKIEGWNYTTPKGEIINMVAARPWGVPCGDPSQHDMPWGTCVLPVECDAEYRIYRGDYFCGRTYFICCSLYFSTYDTYQALDISLQDSALQTDSSEHRDRKRRASHEAKQRQMRDKRRRRRIREERKRKIRRTIKRIVNEVKKILNRAYRNGTRLRRKKTRTMKKFIKYLKQQYRKDRDSAKDIHEYQMYEVDKDLMNKLMDIKEVNNNFMTNETFRDILMNRTMNLHSARMLVDTFPELSAFMNADILRSIRRGVVESSVQQPGGYATPATGHKIEESYERRSSGSRRRLGMRRSGLAQPSGSVKRGGLVTRPYRRRKHGDYDVEYGLLYS